MVKQPRIPGLHLLEKQSVLRLARRVAMTPVQSKVLFLRARMERMFP